LNSRWELRQILHDLTLATRKIGMIERLFGLTAAFSEVR